MESREQIDPESRKREAIAAIYEVIKTIRPGGPYDHAIPELRQIAKKIAEASRIEDIEDNFNKATSIAAKIEIDKLNNH